MKSPLEKVIFAKNQTLVINYTRHDYFTTET